MTDVSFIVSARNCVKLTREMLRSLFEYTKMEGRELIFVDDGSTDDTPEYLRSIADRCQVLTNSENLGFAKSNNRAARLAKGASLMFLNNDLELSPNWLEPMLELHRGQSDVGAVGNIQRNFSTGLVDHAGIFFDLEGMPTHAWKNRKRLPPGEYSERNAITAACFLIDRERFLALGGFDEGYINGMEDVDLCVRLRLQGYRHFVSHRSVIRHHVSQSPGRHRYNDQNSRLYRDRWATRMAEFGSREWPENYFHRYARYWWRMNPRLAFKALSLMLRKSPPDRD